MEKVLVSEKRALEESGIKSWFQKLGEESRFKVTV
jgi:hypothetical protein